MVRTTKVWVHVANIETNKTRLGGDGMTRGKTMIIGAVQVIAAMLCCSS
ncbi:MAG: hypothetical protein ACJA00_005169 [Myxococcota bacterium]|jgi:hypothetical protein